MASRASSASSSWSLPAFAHVSGGDAAQDTQSSPHAPPLAAPNTASVSTTLAAAEAAAASLSSPSARAVSRWLADTPPLPPSPSPLQHPLYVLETQIQQGSGEEEEEEERKRAEAERAGPPANRRGHAPSRHSAAGRPSEPQRRRPTTTAVAPAGTTTQHRESDKKAADSAEGLQLLPLPPRAQEQEELAQLARSLRSEIVGEPFLLTAPFGAATRSPGSASRPSSAFSGGGGGAGGDARRGSSKLRRSINSGRSSTDAARPSMVPARPGGGGASDSTSGNGGGGATARASTRNIGERSDDDRGSPDGASPKSTGRGGVWEAVPLLHITPSTAATTIATTATGSGGSTGNQANGKHSALLLPEAAALPRENAQGLRGSAAQRTADTVTMAARGHTRHPSSPEDADDDEGEDGRESDRAGGAASYGYGARGVGELHSVAELRRRLLTEDFFSSPLRKFRRDGAMPWKLITSVVLCVLLVLQVTWYQLPLARANESMRRAITEQFMGDDFASKGDGDVVAAPTEWMESLYAAVERYVAVYYALSNASSSDMNYYVSPPDGHSAPAAAAHTAAELSMFAYGADMSVLQGNVSDSLPRSPPPSQPPLLLPKQGKKNTTKTTEATRLTGQAAAAPADEGVAGSPPFTLPLSDIAPVVMHVEVDTFSRREGAQHLDDDNANADDDDSDSDAAAAVSRPQRWWGRTAATARTAGRYATEALVGAETRWLTFFVDADHPLGPFAKYRDAARRVRKILKEERRKSRTERKELKRAAKAKKKGGKSNKRRRGGGAKTVAGALPALDAWQLPGTPGVVSAPSAELVMVCAPRLDTLSGRYYRPCASAPATAAAAVYAPAVPSATALDDGDDDVAGGEDVDELDGAAAAVADAASSWSLYPEFSLMDNVRSIRLEVFLRHEVGSGNGDGGGMAGTTELSRLLGDAAEAQAAIFQWSVEKVITVRPGGVVESQLHVRTRMWPTRDTAAPRWRPSDVMAAVLCVLAAFELVLRLRALWRIRAYTARLERERLAFHARQMREQRRQEWQQLQQQLVEGDKEERYRPPSSAAMRSPPSPPPPVAAAATAPPHGLPRAVSATASVPYEWGLPGSPATRVDYRPSASQPALLSFPGRTAVASYGTMNPSAAAATSTVAGGGRRSSATPPPPRSASETDPLLYLVRDTSLNIVAAQHPAMGGQTPAAAATATTASYRTPPSTIRDSEGTIESVGDIDDQIPVAVTLEQRVAGSWFGRQVQRILPRHLSHVRVRRSPLSVPPGPLPAWVAASRAAQQGGGGGGVTPPRASLVVAQHSRGSFAASPLTPELTQRIAERSYVDLHTTWRHHLQLSMGTGWHCVGMLAAALTLCYSALVLLPLCPLVEVAQDGTYDAWTSVLLGSAALTSCVLLLSYLRFFPTLYFPILASTHVVPKLFLFALCVSPLFFGFAFFFMVAFGPYSDGHFTSLGWASMVLYLMTYGDALLDTAGLLSDTPFRVTAAVASAMVIAFALLFMMIMLNIAMTITQHEWLRLRRRFGAALSSSSLLFSVRSRDEVKAEAVEAIRANLEVLWFMLAEEEDEGRKEQDDDDDDADLLQQKPRTGAGATTITTPSAAAAAAAAASSHLDGGGDGEPVRVRVGARAASPRSSTHPSSTLTGAGSGDETTQDSGGHSRQRRRRRHHSSRGAEQQQQQQEERPSSTSTEQTARRRGQDSVGGRNVTRGGSLYDVSVATTAPPE